MSIVDRARPEILALKPYGSARRTHAKATINLDANENPAPPPFLSVGSGLNRYPDPQPERLRARLSELLGVCEERLLLTRGSDEAIDLLTRAFCAAGRDAIVQSTPTFGMYRVAAEIQGARIVDVPLEGDDFLWSRNGVIDAVNADDGIKLVFVCCPNNPTGRSIPRPELQELLDATRERAVIVVDEAYGEFDVEASALTLLPRYEHLAVLRTFSKAYGLAGARLGVLAADPAVIDLCGRVLAPYPLASPTVELAQRALDPVARQWVVSAVRRLNADRAKLADALEGLQCVRRVYPSAANFLLVRFADHRPVFDGLLERGILVRNFHAKPQLEHCLRFSIGTPDENVALIAALKDIDETRSWAA